MDGSEKKRRMGVSLSDTFIYASPSSVSAIFLLDGGRIVHWTKGEEPPFGPKPAVYHIIRLTKAQLTDLILYNFDAEDFFKGKSKTREFWNTLYVEEEAKCRPSRTSLLRS